MESHFAWVATPRPVGLPRHYGGVDCGDGQSGRPAPLDDIRSALRQEFERHRTAELARTVGGAGAGGLEDGAAGEIEHRRAERHIRAVDLGKSRNRRIAMAVEHPQHLALGIEASRAGPAGRPRELGRAVAFDLLAKGAGEIIELSRPK